MIYGELLEQISSRKKIISTQVGYIKPGRSKTWMENKAQFPLLKTLPSIIIKGRHLHSQTFIKVSHLIRLNINNYSSTNQRYNDNVVISV